MGWVGNSGISKAIIQLKEEKKPSGAQLRLALVVSNRDLDTLSIWGETEDCKETTGSSAHLGSTLW